MNETGERGSKRKAMGRGLSALLGDQETSPIRAGRRIQSIPIEWIEPGQAQPRRSFPEEDLNALAASIHERGILQPILLRRLTDGNDRFEIIAGERRWRAAQLAQLHEIPAVIHDTNPLEALEIALIENMQRSDLAPLEEAEGYQRLVEDFGHSHDLIARTIGRSRSHVANTLRLLGLPPGSREHLHAGRITAGHARAILSSNNPDQLANRVVSKGLSVRETEKLAQHKPDGSNSVPSSKRRPEKQPDTVALENRLSETLGLKVDLTVRNQNSGALTIHYRSLQQLDGLLARLAGPGAEHQSYSIDFSQLAEPDQAEKLARTRAGAFIDVSTSEKADND